MSTRVPRTRAGGQWTEARYFGFLRSALRLAVMKYPVKHQVKNRAKELTDEGVRYRCAVCDELFKSGEVQVEHTVPCGSLTCYDDLPGFVERMFCEPDGMTVQCKPCHQQKTNAERAARKKK